MLDCVFYFTYMSYGADLYIGCLAHHMDEAAYIESSTLQWIVELVKEMAHTGHIKLLIIALIMVNYGCPLFTMKICFVGVCFCVIVCFQNIFLKLILKLN
jgi:ABC-type bacteriocin/lantibiotic exporter with double-glycine peptidase domain